jgi:hypothetical protein
MSQPVVFLKLAAATAVKQVPFLVRCSVGSYGQMALLSCLNIMNKSVVFLGILLPSAMNRTTTPCFTFKSKI